MSEGAGAREAPAAIILAGGLGTRLATVVPDRPKPLAVVAGRPFLGYLLDQLAQAGVRRTVLATGHLAGQIAAAFGEAYGPMALAYSAEAAPLGTGGALALAASHLPNAPAVLVLNGDSFVDVDLPALLQAHRAMGSAATLTVVEVPDVARYGRVGLDAAGQVTAFEEKGANGGPGWINAGVYVVAQAVLQAIPPGRAVSLEREVLPGLVGQGLAAFRCQGRFIDIGTPETYAQGQAFFAPPLPEAGK